MAKNWSELLHYIYSHDEKWEYFGEGITGIDETHPFVKETNLSSNEAQAALSFLKRNNLLEEDGTNFYQLTGRGFDVARDQEIRETQLQTNQSIKILTGVLAFVALTELATTAGNQSPLMALALSIIVIVLTTLVGYLLQRPKNFWG